MSNFLSTNEKVLLYHYVGVLDHSRITCWIVMSLMSYDLHGRFPPHRSSMMLGMLLPQMSPS